MYANIFSMEFLWPPVNTDIFRFVQSHTRSEPSAPEGLHKFWENNSFKKPPSAIKGISLKISIQPIAVVRTSFTETFQHVMYSGVVDKHLKEDVIKKYKSVFICYHQEITVWCVGLFYMLRGFKKSFPSSCESIKKSHACYRTSKFAL